MTAESLDENKGRALCALEVHHVYPMKEVRLGGQRQRLNEWSLQGLERGLERGLGGTGFTQIETTNRG
jgi:hypothetical protein